MGKGSADTPDTVGAAKVEGQYGRQAARDESYANRPDQYNSFGNLTWQRENVRDPATGESTTKWTQRENLSPQMKYLFERQMNNLQNQAYVSNNMTNRAMQPFMQTPDWQQFGQVEPGARAGGALGAGVLPTTDTGGFKWGSQNRKRAEDASYKRSTSRLDPQFKEARESKRIQLRNQGLKAGDQAFEAEMDRFNRGRTDAYEQARYGSVDQGRMEDQQSFGQAQGAFGMNRSQEQQAYAQRMGAAQNIRQADQQRFTQEQQSSDQANALRQQQIEEYLNKRHFGFNEQQMLDTTQGAKDLSQAFGSGGK